MIYGNRKRWLAVLLAAVLVFTTAVPVNAAKLSAQTKNVKDVQTENETQEKVAEPVAPSESGASVSWTGAVVHVDVRL